MKKKLIPILLICALCLTALTGCPAANSINLEDLFKSDVKVVCIKSDLKTSEIKTVSLSKFINSDETDIAQELSIDYLFYLKSEAVNYRFTSFAFVLLSDKDCSFEMTLNTQDPKTISLTANEKKSVAFEFTKEFDSITDDSGFFIHIKREFEQKEWFDGSTYSDTLLEAYRFNLMLDTVMVSAVKK